MNIGESLANFIGMVSALFVKLEFLLPVWMNKRFSENKMERAVNACELSVGDFGIRYSELIQSWKLFCWIS